ncbi:MAG: ABC transporter ATP-binding protein [Chloroflexi bacterium RBG_16_51_16]|nr:MAG: ABC transporter ATP-binding protein [Chloroflexi bacterium RBG_16_51_16]
MRTIALEVKNIQKTFSVDGGKIDAVADVSFQVRAGEFVALVGPSGSGKTTLLSILAALLTASSGEVLVDGQDLARMKERQRVELRRKKIGFTFQTNNLIPYLTALENVEFMLRLNGLDGREGRKRSKDLLKRLGLGDRLNNLPGQMSGGQQQRVAIARALIHNPAVVLADEPTASLDTQHAFQVVEAFAKLVHEDGHAGVMVTHDLRMCRYVDRVLQMLDGKLVREYKNRKDIDRLAEKGV